MRRLNSASSCALTALWILTLSGAAAPSPLELETQRREPMYQGGPWWVRHENVRLDPARTAVVVVDMWNGHSCRSVRERVTRLATPMNQTLEAARKLGIQIVFMPSLGSLYANAPKVYPNDPHKWRFHDRTPQRQAIRVYPHHDLPDRNEFDAPKAPYDQAGCMCDPEQSCVGGQSPKYRQHPLLQVKAGDLMGENEQELWNVLAERGITHVIHMGMATNMCVMWKPQGIVNLKRLGLESYLVRDLTDAFTGTGRDPNSGEDDPTLTPDTGLSRVVKHIERHVTPTVTRGQLLAAAGMTDAYPDVFPDLCALPSQTKAEPIFTPEEVRAYKPIGASHCFRHFTLDWNWVGGDLEDYATRADPVEYAEFCKRINLDGAVLMAVSHHGHCSYETEIGEKLPGMRGDLFGETVRELHKRGIAAFAYITLARNWKVPNEHPEWSWPRGSERFICLNTPYLDQVAAISQEVLRKYPVDALRYDTLDLPPSTKRPFPIEHRCEWCAEYYRELYGEEMPEWDATNVRRQLDFMRATGSRAVKRLYEACKAIKPEIEVWQNGFMAHPSFDRNNLEAARYQDMAYVEHSDPFRQLFLQGVTNANGSVVGRILHSPDRRLCMALGGACYTYERVSRYDLLPEKRDWYFNDVAPFYAMVAEVQPYLDRAKPVPYVGFVYCEATRYRFPEYDRGAYVGLLRRIGEAYLARSLVPEYISNLDLPRRDLSRHRVLVLAETSGLRPQDLEALDRYVRQGGRLVVTGDALRFDEQGYARADFALAELMGVSYLGAAPVAAPKSEDEGSALELTTMPGSDLGNLPQKIAVQSAIRVRSTGATTLVAARTKPPLSIVLTNPAGKGKVVYLASSDSTELITAVVDALARTVPVQTSGGERIVLTRQQKQNRWVLHLIDDGEYTVDINGEYVDISRLAGQYPATGWPYRCERTPEGFRVRARAGAKDRLLVFQ